MESRCDRRALVFAVGFAALSGALLVGSLAVASDIPVPVRVYINKSGGTKFVSKGTFALPDPNNDNPVADGGSVTVTSGATSETIALAATGWSALGNPPGSKGFRYRDSTGATCLNVLVKSTTIKGLCRPTTPAAPPYVAGTDPPLSIVLSIGSSPQRYCAECPNGGVQKGSPQLLTKLKDCNAPAACPAETPTPTDTASPAATATATATPTSGPAACGFEPPGMCGGTCPAGEVCGSFGSHLCGCVTAGSCGGTFPACDGACPSGEVCMDPDGTGCLCVGGSCGAFPVCNGSCPGQSSACLTFDAPNPALDSCVCISAGP
jgi:hypothetical protein